MASRLRPFNKFDGNVMIFFSGGTLVQSTCRGRLCEWVDAPARWRSLRNLPYPTCIEVAMGTLVKWRTFTGHGTDRGSVILSGNESGKETESESPKLNAIIIHSIAQDDIIQKTVLKDRGSGLGLLVLLPYLETVTEEARGIVTGPSHAAMSVSGSVADATLEGKTTRMSRTTMMLFLTAY